MRLHNIHDIHTAQSDDKNMVLKWQHLTACKGWVELTTARISHAVRIYGNDCTRH